MVSDSADAWVGAGIALPVDYARLVRLCARLTGDAQAAEDLAQDTLVEAWRQRHKLREPAGGDAWLSAIARNVCLRWATARRRDREHIIAPRPGESAVVPDSVARVADAVDLAGDLERAEVAALVDAALALVPPATRAALIERYMHDAPQSAVAARLGLSEGAVEARLHRGKLALRHALAVTLREDATTFGLAARTTGWGDTRLWCPLCGQRHLQGQFDAVRGAFALRCPACYPTTGVYCSYEWPTLFQGVRGYKPAMGRVMRWANAYYRPALVAGTAPCLTCGRALLIRREQAPEVVAPLHNRVAMPGVHVHCERCAVTCSMRLSNLTLYLPQAWRFWRAHPRIRTLTDGTVEARGQAAPVTRFESVTGAASLDVVTARDTYEVLGIHDRTGI